ncbi:hypothetical protein FF38_01907 [Lucilia cuprina]|uniref:Uncharacterized protein n=1 Tax=Lucilia cuprina TaxID=7375 RepID=A0A0L0CQW6_LUCCU|nr:hypothetical protein FF38_01907 [Lucilia cuprina]
MNLNCETILDFYTHNNKKVLCQIKVKSRKFKNYTCRCLGQEQWNIFDRELEKLITANDEWSDEMCLYFKIKPYIEVKVQKSKLSLKHFYKCLGAIDDCKKEELDDGAVVEDIREANYVLECVLKFKDSPGNVSHKLEGQPLTETTDILSSHSEPYTPSNKRYRQDNIDTVKTPGKDFLEYSESSYSPKLNTINSSESEQPQLCEIISKNTSEPIETCQSSDEVIVETGDEIESPKKNRFKKSKKLETEFISKSQDIPVTDSTAHRVEENSSQRKVTTRDYDIKKHRKRTKTLDSFSEILGNNSNEKHKSKKERSSSRDSQYDNKIFKKRSKTIDEIPVELFQNIEIPNLNNLTDESKEKSRKKKESTDKHKSDKSEDIKEKPCTKSDSKDKSEDIEEKGHKKLDPTEKSTSHKSEERKEKLYKKLESSDKYTSHKSKERKKDVNDNISSTKQIVPLLEKKHVSSDSSSVDEFLEAHVKSKKPAENVSDDDFEDQNNEEENTNLSQSNDNTSSLNISISSATESNTDTSPRKVTKRERKPKETSSDVNKSVRRSSRSPTKTKRFIEEQPNLLKSNRSKKAKTSPKNIELFGTDDDDDEENYFEKNSTKTNNNSKVKSSIFETPVSKKSEKSASSSSSSSTKKKRKRVNKSSECEQEKRAMGNWLGKKKSSSSDIEEKNASTSKSSSSKSRPLKTTKKEKTEKNEVDTEKHAKTVTPTPSFELPSKEEMELIRNKSKLTQKENAILKAELDKMRTSPPKEVEFKSLQDIPADEILNTFSIYQTELDEIYKNNYKRDYIKGHEGINHCFVIRLLPQNIQMKMLEKLTDIYSNTKSSTQATLFANALLPEWVIRVYMEKYKFNRQEAIHQIKAQEEFRLHVEEQSDNSFMFD